MSSYTKIPHCEFVVKGYKEGIYWDLLGLFDGHPMLGLYDDKWSKKFMEFDSNHNASSFGRDYTLQESYNISPAEVRADYGNLQDQIDGHDDESRIRAIDDFFVVIYDGQLTIWDHNMDYSNKDKGVRMLYRPVATLNHMHFLDNVNEKPDEFTEQSIKKHNFDSNKNDWLADQRLMQRTLYHQRTPDTRIFSVLFKTGVHKFTFVYHDYHGAYCVYDVIANNANYDAKYESGYYANKRHGWCDIPQSLFAQESTHKLKIKKIFHWTYEFDAAIKNIKRAHARHFNRMYGAAKER